MTFQFLRQFNLNPKKFATSFETLDNQEEYEALLKELNSATMTDIDTIKPDDYTVVGDPTITDDGILSLSTYSNYIKTPNIPLNASSTILETNFIYQRGTAFAAVWWFKDNNDDIRLGASGNGGVSLYTTKYPSIITFSEAELNNIQNGTLIKTKTIFTTNSTTLNVIINGTEYTKTVLNGLLSNALLSIDIGGHNSNNILSINLNSFKIYTGGNLVYQPCLKIPYTLTSDGDKIVNAIYSDRVQDMYEQFGYAPYYIIDENNQTYSLPVTNQPSLNFNNNDITVNNKPNEERILTDQEEELFTDNSLSSEFSDIPTSEEKE